MNGLRYNKKLKKKIILQKLKNFKYLLKGIIFKHFEYQ